MKRYLPVILLVACAAAFVLGVVQLFKLRFESGDVFPEYSSLRADPLGTMAFYESLDQLPGISVRRDHSSANRLPAGKNTSYLHLAARTYEWEEISEETWKEIDSFVHSGGRLAITFFPEKGQDTWSYSIPVTTTNTATGTNAPGAKGITTKRGNLRKKLKEQDGGVQGVSVAERWGVSFGHAKLNLEDDSYQAATVTNATHLALPRTLDWHSAAVFTNLHESWQPIYMRGNDAVVIERKFGAGAVVMATDSYFLSNEAMRKDRHAELLAWLVGASQHVVFDEAHLGIVDTGGVASLIRQYRLHGVALGLLVLAGLFIWKNSVSLVPVHTYREQETHVAGKDAAAGFVNLLRRNIAPRDLLGICFDEWTKTMMQGRHYTLSGVDQAQTIMEAENARQQRDPVTAYLAIAKALNSSTRNPKLETRNAKE